MKIEQENYVYKPILLELDEESNNLASSGVLLSLASILRVCLPSTTPVAGDGLS